MNDDLTTWDDVSLLPMLNADSLVTWKRKLRSVYRDLGHDVAVFDEVAKYRNCPTLNAIAREWAVRRDPSWLYTHPLYVFETLNCALYNTVKPHNDGVPDLFSTARNVLKHMELLEYDERDSFSVYELGAGLGLTSLLIAKRFPNATVYFNDENETSRAVFSTMAQIAKLNNVVVLQPGETPQHDVDVMTAFEVVEHIGSMSRHNVGSPMAWLDEQLQLLSLSGLFMYETMWNAEWRHPGKILGHFLTYEFDGRDYVKKEGAHGTPFHSAFQEALYRRRFERVDGRYGRGRPDGLKWSLRGGPKLYAYKA